MSNRCVSIRQEDLSKALEAAVNIEQQRIENLSNADAETVAGGVTLTQPVIIGGGTSPGSTMGMYPTGDQSPTGSDSTSSF